MKKPQVTLMKYENTSNSIIYFGYKKEECMCKEIDGIMYMEVCDSIVRPKIQWVRMDQMTEVGTITFDRP